MTKAAQNHIPAFSEIPYDIKFLETVYIEKYWGTKIKFKRKINDKPDFLF